MIFLIEYNRPQGRIITFSKFKNSDRVRAEKKRFELELNLNRNKVNHEVVLLEASTENLLRRTHRRYFETVDMIAGSRKKS